MYHKIVRIVRIEAFVPFLFRLLVLVRTVGGRGTAEKKEVFVTPFVQHVVDRDAKPLCEVVDYSPDAVAPVSLRVGSSTFAALREMIVLKKKPMS